MHIPETNKIEQNTLVDKEEHEYNMKSSTQVRMHTHTHTHLSKHKVSTSKGSQKRLNTHTKWTINIVQLTQCTCTNVCACVCGICTKGTDKSQPEHSIVATQFLRPISTFKWDCKHTHTEPVEDISSLAIQETQHHSSEVMPFWSSFSIEIRSAHMKKNFLFCQVLIWHTHTHTTKNRNVCAVRI